jgi:TRAP-type C4-dicarboxylate transport system permease small subunit
MSILVFVKVIFRYLLNDPIVWSDEVIMLMLLALTYFGSALAFYKRGHINVELLEMGLSRIGTRAVRQLRLVLDIIIIAVLAPTIWFAFRISLYSMDQQTDVMLLSYFWVYILLPIGLTAMILMVIKRNLDDRTAGGVPQTDRMGGH